METISSVKEPPNLKTTKTKNPYQVLSQSVCQKYGWSATYGKLENGHWACTIQIGRHDVRSFSGIDKAAASQMALDSLQERIEKEEKKPLREMVDVVKKTIPIYESTDENWEYVWKRPPSVVGIDTEGNLSAPPILVQVAIDDYVILEVPANNELSHHLQRLLKDDSITKVFCDNYSHKDKASLGIQFDASESWDKPPVVDLEAMGAACFGSVTVPRGLGRIMNLLELYPEVRIGKPKKKGSTHRNHVGRFTWMEQGKAPRITSVHELTNEERYYAAVDAVCTLEAYEALR